MIGILAYSIFRAQFWSVAFELFIWICIIATGWFYWSSIFFIQTHQISGPISSNTFITLILILQCLTHFRILWHRQRCSGINCKIFAVWLNLFISIEKATFVISSIYSCLIFALLTIRDIHTKCLYLYFFVWADRAFLGSTETAQQKLNYATFTGGSFFNF